MQDNEYRQLKDKLVGYITKEIERYLSICNDECSRYENKSLADIKKKNDDYVSFCCANARQQIVEQIKDSVAEKIGNFQSFEEDFLDDIHQKDNPEEKLIAEQKRDIKTLLYRFADTLEASVQQSCDTDGLYNDNTGDYLCYDKNNQEVDKRYVKILTEKYEKYKDDIPEDEALSIKTSIENIEEMLECGSDKSQQNEKKDEKGKSR